MSAAFTELLRAVMEAALQQGPIDPEDLATLQETVEQNTDVLPELSPQLIHQAEVEIETNPNHPIAQFLIQVRPFIALATHAREVVDQLIEQSGHQVEADQRAKLLDIFSRARIYHASLTGAPLVPAMPVNDD